MRNLASFLVVVALCIGLMFVSGPAKAQFGDLKNKLKVKAQQKAKEKVDTALNKAPADTTKAAEKTAQSKEKTAQPAGAAKGGTAAAEDMTLYTKYDFVPGDKVIFYDDLANDEIGEFPSRWNLDNGVFEVAKQGAENYIMCTDKGSIRPKIAAGPLPPKYTVEMEFYCKGPDFKGHWFTIQWVGANDEIIGELWMKDNHATRLRILEKDLADKALPADLSAGKHTMRVMATKSSPPSIRRLQTALLPSAAISILATWWTWGRSRSSARIMGTWDMSQSIACRPQRIRSAASGLIAAARALAMPVASECAKAGSLRWTPLSIPMASAVRIASVTRSGPRVTTTVSPPCFSFSLSACSTAYSS